MVRCALVLVARWYVSKIRIDALSRLDEVQGHMGIYGNRGYGKPQWVSYHEMQGMSGIWTRGNHI